MSKNTDQQDQLEMGNRRSRSPAHESATQAVAPKPAAAVLNIDNTSQSQTRLYKPFVADQLNVERRVVLQLREGFGLKDSNNNKIHAAFEIFNVAANVSAFCPLPPFELRGELLEAFKEYLTLEGKTLSTADRYSLSRVTTVGDRFLYRCSGLKTIDLSPLSNLTTIGHSFLSECSDLKRVDLSSLSYLTNVGGYFLWNCSRLEKINLSALSNLTTIGDFFLYCCTGLNTIDLSPLSNLTTVGDGFLFKCSGLKTIGLSSLSNLTTVGDGFLSNCTDLKTIDLSPLSNVATVGDRFLNGCSDTVQDQRWEFLSLRSSRGSD